MDPKAEKHSAWTPYVFVKDNPMNRIDPDGNEDILVKQVQSSEKTSAESKWLVYPTGTFNNIDAAQLREMSVGDIASQFGAPLKERIGSSLPDNPYTPEKGTGNPTVAEGKYTYTKGPNNRNTANVLWLNQGKGLGVIETVYENPNQGGKKFATQIQAHAANKAWQNQIFSGKTPTTIKDSHGCITCVKFGSLYREIQKQGNFIIVRDSKESKQQVKKEEKKEEKKE